MSLTEKERADLVHALTWDAKRFGQELADTAYARGLAVTNKDDGTTKPIPITATPVIVDAEELQRRQQLAARLASATLKMSRAVLANPDRQEIVLGGLSPLERELAAFEARPGAVGGRARDDVVDCVGLVAEGSSVLADRLERRAQHDAAEIE